MPPAEPDRPSLRDGFPPSYPILQPPNPPLAVFFAAKLADLFVGGRAGDFLTAIALVALTIWAYEELVRGVNTFRRLLGAGVLVPIIVRLADQLG